MFYFKSTVENYKSQIVVKRRVNLCKNLVSSEYFQLISRKLDLSPYKLFQIHDLRTEKKIKYTNLWNSASWPLFVLAAWIDYLIFNRIWTVVPVSWSIFKLIFKILRAVNLFAYTHQQFVLFLILNINFNSHKKCAIFYFWQDYWLLIYKLKIFSHINNRFMPFFTIFLVN